MPEIIDIYDKNRNKTGLQLPRKQKLVKGQFMLYVLALIENQEHKYLVTRRALDKKWAAGSWEIPGGGADAGETAEQAIRREILEETGLDTADCELKVLYSYRNEDAESGDNYFADIFLCRKNFTLEDVTMQKSEVIDIRLASLAEITALYHESGFLHYQRICEALNTSAAAE